MSAAPYRLGFIGTGKLAGSVIRGLLLKNFCTPDGILASEPNVETRAQLENKLGLRLTTQNSEIAAKAEIVFLGVKPQMVLAVLRELGDAIANKLVVSFAAGIRIAQMEEVTSAHARAYEHTKRDRTGDECLCQRPACDGSGSRKSSRDVRGHRLRGGSRGRTN